MGQVYLVEAKLIFKNRESSEKFCEMVRAEQHRYAYAEGLDLNDPRDCFLAVTGGRGSEGFDPTDPDVWSSGFDASYSWEGFLYDLFEKALELCEVGSWVTCWPDEGHWTLRALPEEARRLEGVLWNHYGKEWPEPGEPIELVLTWVPTENPYHNDRVRILLDLDARTMTTEIEHEVFSVEHFSDLDEMAYILEETDREGLVENAVKAYRGEEVTR